MFLDDFFNKLKNLIPFNRKITYFTIINDGLNLRIYKNAAQRLNIINKGR